jgi:8'-apo-carotenoid 13,14-cleaving dioxygenase
MASTVETIIRRTATKAVLKVAEINRSRMDAPDQPHPYLSGIHAPMAQELTLTDLKVTGTIPPELDGRYIRIGPNPATPPNPAAYHWFTGDGMVHGVRLQNGKALWYRNRWVRSNAVSAALGEIPAPGPRNGNADTANTNVLGHAGEIWALVESGAYPVRINQDLETIAHDPFGGSLKGSFTAHPHLDPLTGEMHAICYDAAEHNVIRHVVVDASGTVRREEPISVKHGPSIHDCMITKNYVLIFDLPMTFSMKTLLAGHAFPYAWNPDHQARVGLLPREGKEADIIWCTVSPCFVFHPCNAFETEDGMVIVDVVAHDTMGARSTQGPDSDKVTFERWTIDEVACTVERNVIDHQPQEFPRPDERLLGQPYRYAYTSALVAKIPPALGTENSIIKHDMATRTREVHDFGKYRYPGEFIFVPKHADSAEDEGWMLGYVVNMATQTTDFVILNAQDFAGVPQAVITIPHRIPPGFHGNWVAA